jgi:uncharacterized tellurite resistance protein B-like protein
MKFSQNIKAKLFEIEDQKTNYEDLQLVAAILMFAVISADGDLDQLEIAHMVDILRSRHALSSNEISSLLQSAKKATLNDQGIEGLTKVLCQQWNEKERTQLLHDFWDLATADDEIKIDERLMIELIANNLDLEEKEITRARFNAEQRLELNIF